MEKINMLAIKINVYVIVVVLSLLSTAVSGYQFAVSDQEIFIPYILKLQDSQLFPNDLLFSQFTANASLFYQIVAFLIRFIDMETVFFLGYNLSKILFFLGIFLISKQIFKKTSIAYLSLLPFLLPKFIGGTATLTYDTSFGYRSLGVIFLIYYLYFLLKNRFIIASILSSIALFFHPLSIIPNLVLLTVLILKNSKNKTRDLLYASILFLLSALIYNFIFKVNANYFNNSQGWFSIIKERADYLFLTNWSILGWASLGLYLFLLYFHFKTQKSNGVRSKLLLITVFSLIVFIINFILLEVLKIPSFAKFQLVRSITPIAYLGLILSPSLLFFKQKLSKFAGFVSFISLSLNLYYVFFAGILLLLILNSHKKSWISFPQNTVPKIIVLVITIAIFLNAFHFKNPLEFPKEKNDWIDVQLWAKDNTDKSAKFLVPPNQTGFRIFSQRSIVGDVKDGAVVVYSQQYALTWKEIMSDLKNYERKDEKGFKDLQRMYSFNYLITSKKHNLHLIEIYGNSSYQIYKL